MFPTSSAPSGGNRIDVTTLTPFNFEVGNVATTGGAFVTALSITGKGFLDSFYLTSPGTTSQVRVTIDGVLKVLLSTPAGAIVGIGNKTDIYPSGTAGTVVPRQPASFTSSSSQAPAAVKPYPTIDNSDGFINLGDAKVYFYSSLLLEYSTTVINARYKYSGAYR